MISCSHDVMYTWGSLGFLATTITGLLLIFEPLDGNNRDGFSGAATAVLLLPQNTLVTLSMTLVLVEWCLFPRRPLILLVSSAEARSTTPWADIDDMVPSLRASHEVITNFTANGVIRSAAMDTVSLLLYIASRYQPSCCTHTHTYTYNTTPDQ